MIDHAQIFIYTKIVKFKLIPILLPSDIPACCKGNKEVNKRVVHKRKEREKKKKRYQKITQVKNMLFFFKIA